jgi:hypothetical protein
MGVVGPKDLERRYAQGMYIAVVGAYNLRTILAVSRQLGLVVRMKHGAMTVPSCPPRP